MKILLAIKAMGESGGGTERILADLAGYLVEMGHEISLLTLEQQDTPSFYPIDKRVERHYLRIGNISSKTTLTEFLKRTKYLRQYVAREKPDIVVGFMHSIYVSLAFAMIGLRMPLVGSEHIVPEHYRDNKLEFLLIIVSSLFINRFTLLSESIRASYPWMVRRKSVVMRNPVVIDLKTKTFPGEKKAILSVGRLDSQKDHITLIRAFGKLSERFQDWKLRIIGEGPLREELEMNIEKLNLKSKVFMPGATKNVAAEYAKADFFVIPSRYESFGLATAEAMGYGLAVIGFEDCPGTNELIKDMVNGKLVNSEDRVNNLSLAMEELMENELLRKNLGNKGRSTAEAFSPLKIFARWEKFLQDMQ